MASLVRDLLREHLLQDGRKRGYRLPYEHLLTRDLDCSRNVLREALALLVADGILRRERGRGTHVLTVSPAISIDQGLDLAGAMRPETAPVPAGDAVGYQVLRAGLEPTSSVLAGLLQVTAGSMAGRIERLVTLQARRIGHWDIYISVVRPGSPLGSLAGTHTTELLLRGLGLHPAVEETRLEAISPSPRTADLLYHGKRGNPTLRVTRRFYDASGQPVAFAIGRCAWPAATFSVVRDCGEQGQARFVPPASAPVV
jgi:DNA-binding GntR family transcriptional regulator